MRSSHRRPDSGSQRLTAHEGAPNPGLPRSPLPPSAQSTRLHTSAPSRSGLPGSLWPAQGSRPRPQSPLPRSAAATAGSAPAGTSGLQGRRHRVGRGAQRCSGPPEAHSLRPRAEAAAPTQPSPRWAEQGSGLNAPIKPRGTEAGREPARSPWPTLWLTSQVPPSVSVRAAGRREPRAQPRPGTRVQEDRRRDGSNAHGCQSQVPVPDGRLTEASLEPRTCKTRPRALPSPTALPLAPGPRWLHRHLLAPVTASSCPHTQPRAQGAARPAACPGRPTTEPVRRLPREDHHEVHDVPAIA